MILATSYTLPYKVMRCAAATGSRPIVVGVADREGNDPERFRRSRSCTYVELPVPLSHPEAVPRLRAIIREHRIRRVAPGDIDATRFLVDNARHFRGLYPLPDPATFERLDDKWRFASVCRTVGVPHPRTWVVEDTDALRSFVETADVELIAKPLAAESGEGVARVDRTTCDRVTYEPVLLQEFIDGEDRCISLICRDGDPKVSVVYHYEDGAFIIHRDDRILALASRIVGSLGYDGVINFDVRETPDGELYFIEANPRFWANVDKTLIGGGCNFVEAGFATYAPDSEVVHVRSAVVRTLPAMARGLLKGHGLSAADRRYLRFTFAESMADVVRDGLRRQLEKLRRKAAMARRSDDLPVRAPSWPDPATSTSTEDQLIA